MNEWIQFNTAFPPTHKKNDVFSYPRDNIIIEIANYFSIFTDHIFYFSLKDFFNVFSASENNSKT